MSRTARQLLGFAVALVLFIVIWSLPAPAGLTPLGQRVLATMVAAIVLWIFGALPNEIVTLLALTVLILSGVKPATALAGFSNTAVWLMAGAFCYGFAMAKSGLIQRVALNILKLVQATYAGILFGYMVAGSVLSLAVPSQTVRVAMFTPLSWSLVKAQGIVPRSQESAFLMLGAYEMMFLPGTAFLTGSLWGPIILGLVSPELREQITWLYWFKVLAVPSVVVTIGMYVALLLIFRPKQELLDREGFHKLAAELGPMKPAEIATALILGLSVVAWITEPWHHVPSYLVALLGLVALFAFRVVEQHEFGQALNFNTLVFIGGAFCLAATFQAVQIDQWLAGMIGPILSPLAQNIFLFTAAVVIVVYLVRFVEVSAMATPVIVFLPLVSTVQQLGIPPLVLGGIVVMSAQTFLFEYLFFVTAMALGLTGRQGWKPSQQAAVGVAWMVVNLGALLVGALYWKAIGLV
jgi:DASS family divalent anion:Na+ symporter